MASNGYARLAAGLASYFRRNGLTWKKGIPTGELVRFAERVSGKVCTIDRWQYLAEFAKEQRIFAKAAKPKKRGPTRFQRSLYPKSDPFYLSREWQTLRYRVIRDCGGKCQCCGATAHSSGRPLHVDHIQPRSKRPDLSLDYNNLQVLCEACNMGKGNTDSINWKQRVTAEDPTAQATNH